MIKCKNLAIWDENDIGQEYEPIDLVDDFFWFGKELKRFLPPGDSARLQNALDAALDVLRQVADRDRGAGLVGRCGPGEDSLVN